MRLFHPRINLSASILHVRNSVGVFRAQALPFSNDEPSPRAPTPGLRPRRARSIDSQNLLIKAPGDSQYELQGSNPPRVWRCFLKPSVSLSMREPQLTSHPTVCFHRQR
ncbi:hypothetical protein TcCL_ESM02570 [Trypanosoma cruzi]|nr:hypothetical protein TcCL_ESM02570 [Trypanosoma cruzi]